MGLIGGRVGAHLQNVGHEILLGTRNLNRKPLGLMREDVVSIDYLKINSIAKALTNIDLVIHAAGMSAVKSLENPDLTI
jgi:hypothetical protein